MVVGDQQVGHREQGGVPGFHAGDGEVGEENVQRKARMKDQLEGKENIILVEQYKTRKFVHMIPSERQKTSLLT